MVNLLDDSLVSMAFCYRGMYDIMIKKTNKKTQQPKVGQLYCLLSLKLWLRVQKRHLSIVSERNYELIEERGIHQES